jgi:hypothetical protein
VQENLSVRKIRKKASMIIIGKIVKPVNVQIRKISSTKNANTPSRKYIKQAITKNLFGNNNTFKLFIFRT